MPEEQTLAAFSRAEAQALVAGLREAGRLQRPLRLPAGFAQRCSPAQAQALQAAHQRALLAEIGGEVIGLKLGGTTTTALDALGLAAPFTGPLLSARCQASPARLARSGFIACILECEIGLRLGRELPPSVQPPSREQLLDAIDQVVPAIELADSRLVDWARQPATAIVADLGYAGAWVPGAPCAGWRALDFCQLAVSLHHDGRLLREGSGAMVLGDPLQALARVLAERGRRGLGLAAGSWISTGSCTAPLPIALDPADPPGGLGRYVADFGALGQVQLDLV